MLMRILADMKQPGCTPEIWEQDLTDTFKIEGSDQGMQKVNLKCGSDSMHVMLETEKPFKGVMYTRAVLQATATMFCQTYYKW
ncbi:hypothetical protein EVAR_73570_1 [Eumeta japonica]|uniref:Uncharacterized protein n=1 Tax=Eumeta variegata TaxID=151549 RepID=A0A4C1SU77_EUMVA|nr:hypothetical protein EVAR_73570_1 [Eumeta japonica]